MSNGFTKLFSDIVTSTIWQEPNDCRVLWVTILALKDEENICRATVPALSKLCNITNEKCEEYLQKFQEPDKYSRSQDFEGRRIERVDGGFFVLNGQKYRDMLRGQERREYIREKVAQHRERVKACKQDVNKSNHGNQCKPIAEAEAEAEAEAVPPNPPMGEDPASKIIEHLNQLTGKTYRTNTLPYLKAIRGRLSEVSNDVPGIFLMLARQVALWENTDMEKYLTPDTLFRPSKFPKYYDERNLPLPKVHSPVSAPELDRQSIGGPHDINRANALAKIQRMQQPSLVQMATPNP